MTCLPKPKTGAAASPPNSRRPTRVFDEAAKQAISLKCVAAAMKVPPSAVPSYRPLPALERLQELFDYQPTTGLLINRVQRGGLKVGDVAGLTEPDRDKGYVTVYIDNQAYRAHRICFKMHHGRDPVGQIDHINGARSDNRVANLREVTPLQNARNRHVANGRVPIVGVSFCTASELYMAFIGIGGETVQLGKYQRVQCAVAARKHAEQIVFDLPGNRRVD